jgi:hypothetical protein
MPENKDEWIVIAQGEDGLITHWNDDFEPVMNQIDRYVNAIDGYQLDLDWKQICDRVPHLKGKPWEISRDQPWREYLENLEYTMGCDLTDEEWDAGMPGQSGHFLTLQLQASQKQFFLKTMEQLRNSLDKYWEEHHLQEP